MKINFKGYLPDKWFFFPIVGLALCFISKIIQMYIQIYEFPFDNTADLKHRMIYLFFLKEYKFHQLITDAYHNIILFKDYPPGWDYFTFPFYFITNNLNTAIVLSLSTILILGFMFIYFLNKNLTLTKRIAFFLFLFANLQMLDYLQIGRYPEILGWVVFIPLFYYLALYKKRKVDFKFFLIVTGLFSSLILTHIYVTVVSSIALFSLFFIKDYKEKLIIFLTILTSFSITSFWWVSFLDFIKNFNFELQPYLEYYSTKELLNSGSFISYNTLFILSLFLISFFYIKQKQTEREKNNQDILFLVPSLLFGFIMLTRLIIFIPIFNKVPVTPYNVYFLFLAIYLFFQTDFKTEKIHKVIPLILILFTLSSLFICYFRITPFVPPKDELKIELISFFPIIKDNFVILDSKDAKYNLVNYAKIKYNLSSPDTLVHWVNEDSFELKTAFKNKDCPKLKSIIQKLDLKNIIAYDQGCETLKKCGLNEVLNKKRACLYHSEQSGRVLS